MAWEIMVLGFRLFWRHLGILLLANICWLLLSLPLVTWPAATAGLFYLAARICEEELEASPHSASLADFWQGWRMLWRPASLLAAASLAVLLVVGVALVFYAQRAEPLRWLVGPIALLGFGLGCGLLYLFPLLARRQGRAGEILREALLIALRYPLTSASLVLSLLILALGALLLAGPILFLFFSFAAMVQTIALRYVLARRGEIRLIITPEERALHK